MGSPIGLRTFRALRNYNYRLYWCGQLVSLTGTWIHRTANAWLVLELSGSPLAVGVISMLQFLPALLFGLFGGVLADRFDRRRLLLASQTAAMAVALTLAAFTASGRVTVPLVGALAFALGLVQVVDSPARHSFIVEMVGREDLPNAIALNSVVFNAARIAGPAAAGLLIAEVGFAACFLLNAVSYLAAIVALWRMRTELLHRTAPRARGAVLQELREGLAYARRSPDVQLIVGLMAVVGTFGINFNVLLPILAQDTLHLDAVGYGLLFSALGAGSLVGALVVASLGQASFPQLLLGATALGACQLLLAALPRPGLAAALVFLCGLANITYTATSNSTLQLRVPDALRGRVVGLYLYVFMGTSPLGNLIVGYLAEHGGAPLAFAVGGGVSALAALAAWGIYLRRLQRARLTASAAEAPAAR